MKKRKKIRASQIVLFLVSFVLLIFSAVQYLWIAGAKREIRVRFRDEVLRAGALDDYYEQRKDEKDTNVPDITLWNLKEQVSVTAGDFFGADGFTLIEGYGNLEKIIPGRRLNGAYPPRSDTDGCALSDTGAKGLFGSSNVLGMKLNLLGREYIIRGIVEDKTPMLWIQNPQAVFPYAEMTYQKQTAASVAEEWLMRQGYGEPEAMLAGCDYGAVNFLFITLPLWLFCIYLYLSLKTDIKKVRNSYLRYVLRFLWPVGLILLIFAGIRLSFRFSLDYIPARWSDFGFYGKKAAELANAAERIAGFKRLPGDAELIRHSKMSAYFAWGSLAFMLWAIGRRIREKARLRRLAM